MSDSDAAQQEELHVAAVGEGLLAAKIPVVPACKYQFPGVVNTETFFYVANIITSANFGTIIGANIQLAANNPGLTPPSVGILGVETRHDAFLRQLGGYIPNPAPFETGIPIAWGYNIGLAYTVPGSCPVEVALPTYPTLQSSQPLVPTNTAYPASISFTWDPQQAWVSREAGKQIYVAWLFGENFPVYTPLTVTKPGAGTTKPPPGLQSVVFIALTTLQPLDFDNLAEATLAGPAAIVIS